MTSGNMTGPHDGGRSCRSGSKEPVRTAPSAFRRPTTSPPPSRIGTKEAGSRMKYSGSWHSKLPWKTDPGSACRDAAEALRAERMSEYETEDMLALLDDDDFDEVASNSGGEHDPRATVRAFERKKWDQERMLNASYNEKSNEKEIYDEKAQLEKAAESMYTIYFLVIDERGDFGFKSNSMKALVLVGSGTFRPEEFAEISKRFPTNTKGRPKPKERGVLKFRTSSYEIRMGVAEAIGRSDAEVFVISYIKDKKLPIKSSRIYGEMFEELVETAVVMTGAKVFDIKLDESTYLKIEDALVGIKDIEDRRKVRISFGIIQTEDSNLMQTNEFSVGHTSQFEEIGDSTGFAPFADRIKSWKRWKMK